MRTLFFAHFLLLLHMGYTQTPIDALVNAERSFAALAAKTTTRHAFLSFLDSNSVVFSQGEIRNGLTRWTRDIAEDSSLLLWHPEFAVLSSSGDFGCTMGPSEYRIGRGVQATGQYGHFASLWHKSKSGKWTVLCDIGVQHDDAAEESRVVKKPLPYTGGMLPDTAAAAEQEGQFMDAFKAGQRNLLKLYSAPDAWLLLAGKLPIRSREMDEFDETVLGHYQFELVGHWLSSAGDMRVSYGKTLAGSEQAKFYVGLDRRQGPVATDHDGAKLRPLKARKKGTACRRRSRFRNS